MKRAILVIGPPRSGTSVVSHVINELGADFGDPSRFVDPEKHTFNPIFFELQSLNDLNDEVFVHFGKTLGKADWIPEREDFDEALVEAFRPKVAALIESEFRGSATIGLKDTRFCFTLPLWEAILPRLGYEVSCVLVRRAAHPTFASNQSLNNFSDAVNFRLIAQASLAARHFLEGREPEVVRYEELLRKPKKIVEQLCAGLRLDPSRVESARAVIRGDLNHQEQFSKTPHFHYFSKVIDAPSWAPDDYFTYREIFAAAQEGAADKAQLAGSLEAQRGEFEALKHKSAELGGQMAELTRVLGEREAQIAAMTRDLVEREGRIAGLAQQASERDARIADLVRDVAAHEAQIAALGRDLAEREGLNASLGAALRDLDERIASAMEGARVRDEQISGLTSAVAERDRSIEEARAWRSRDETAHWRIPKPQHAARAVAAMLSRWARDRLPAARATPGIVVHGGVRGAVDWPPAGRVSVVSAPCVVSGWCADFDAHSAAKVRVVVGRHVHETQPRVRPDVKDAYAGLSDLPLETGFASELDLAAGLHRVVVQAQVAGGEWIELRRALVLRLPGMLRKEFWRPKPAPRGTDNALFAHESIVANVDWPPRKALSVVTRPCSVSGWRADLEADSAPRVRILLGNTVLESEARERADVRQAYATASRLPLDTGFAAELDLPAGLHRVTVEVQARTGEWIPMRRTLVLRVPGNPFGHRQRKARRQKTTNEPFIHGSILAFVDWPPTERLWVVSEPCVVSGWGVDLAAVSAASVRVIVDDAVCEPQARDRLDVTGTFAAYSALPAGTGFAAELDLPLGVHGVTVETKVAGGQWVPVRRAKVLRIPRVLGKPFWQRRGARSASASHDAAQPFILGSLFVHVDKPDYAAISVAASSCEVSGWGADLEPHTAAAVRVVVNGEVLQPYAMAREDVQTAFSTHSTLPLETGFKVILALAIGAHRMRIQVQAPDGKWVTVRRTLLLRLPFLKAGLRRNTAISYARFARREKKRQQRELHDIRRHIEVMSMRPMFTVIVDARSRNGPLGRTLRSIERQWYQSLEVCVVGDARHARPSTSGEAHPIKWLREPSLSDARGAFVVMLESGEALAENALYEFASAINHSPEADLIYADEDFIDAFGRHARSFQKPDWSPDYLETFNYIGFPACYRVGPARECLPAASRYDFVLRFAERAGGVMHLEKVLGHSSLRRDLAAAEQPAKARFDVAALEGRLRRTGRAGTVREHVKHAGCYEIRLQLARIPRVSVVLPTAGKTISLGERSIDLIVNVVTQLRHQTTYPDLEIVVIDNGDLTPAQSSALDELRCIRTTYTEPVFNIAKKLNMGATLASGELLLILNDDIEILEPSWIDRLVEQFEKPHVGVVGGKLLYPDGLTQHVGVVHNGGNPAHVRRMRPYDEAGYFYSTCGVRNYVAVTGACMMTPAALYRDVGGYSEALAVSFNDVDYCFKVREKGLQVVYAAGVELIHMESQSRVAFADPKEVAWFHNRWAADLVTDRFYNEQFLTCAPPTFEPCVNPRMV